MPPLGRAHKINWSLSQFIHLWESTNLPIKLWNCFVQGPRLPSSSKFIKLRLFWTLFFDIFSNTKSKYLTIKLLISYLDVVILLGKATRSKVYAWRCENLDRFQKGFYNDCKIILFVINNIRIIVLNFIMSTSQI